MLQELIMAKNAWYSNTKDKEQNSLTKLIPKINRKHDSIHANMANDMTGTTISRHVGELVPLPRSNKWHGKATNNKKTCS